MSRTTKRALATGVAVALAAVTLAMTPGQAQESTLGKIDALYGRLPWRFIGPEGNRVTAVTGVPGDPLVYYAGAASGGIWKTSDGGQFWEPVFDGQPVSAIGALAVSSSDPNVVWAGTGEPFFGLSTNISLGMGIYKSTDAGNTWTQMGLEKTGRIARLAVDPANANVAFACALGHAFGPQPERGVFRTTDGGKSWDRVLFVDENTGCSDLAMNPKNPRILLAGMWQLQMTRGGWIAEGLAAACSSHAMAARPGSGSPTACRSRRSASGRWRSRSRRRTRSACTRSLKPAAVCPGTGKKRNPERSGGRKTRARAGA